MGRWASAGMPGGICINYNNGNASGKNYPVKLSSGKAYVNVPWTEYSLPATRSFSFLTNGNLTINFQMEM